MNAHDILESVYESQMGEPPTSKGVDMSRTDDKGRGFAPRVRPMRIDDAHAVWGVTTRSLGYACEEDTVARQIEKLVDDPHYLCLVCEDGPSCEVVAFLQAEEYETLHNSGGWNVINLAVAPERQGEGVGRQLLTAFEKVARQRGGTFVRLNSRMERTGAHAFYEHVGYESAKTQRHFSKRIA